MPYRDPVGMMRRELPVAERRDGLGEWLGRVVEELGDVWRGQYPTSGQRRRAQRRAMRFVAEVEREATVRERERGRESF